MDLKGGTSSCNPCRSDVEVDLLVMGDTSNLRRYAMSIDGTFRVLDDVIGRREEIESGLFVSGILYHTGIGRSIDFTDDPEDRKLLMLYQSKFVDRLNDHRKLFIGPAKFSGEVELSIDFKNAGIKPSGFEALGDEKCFVYDLLDINVNLDFESYCNRIGTEYGDRIFPLIREGARKI